MCGVTELAESLARLRPRLGAGCYVFCTVAHAVDVDELVPFATVREEEGLTLVLEQVQARQSGYRHEGVFRRITLNVHSSVQSVGLTAAVAGALAARGISANVVAGFHHDHVFVPAGRAEEALGVIEGLAVAGDPVAESHVILAGGANEGETQ